jgi:hypothetical protein
LPIILNQLDDIIAEIGQTIDFTVFVKKTHIPVSIQCFKNNDKLIKIDGQKYLLEHDSEIYSFRFIIKDVSNDDSSPYSFVISNVFGQASVSASLLTRSNISSFPSSGSPYLFHLYILDKPIILSPVKNIEVLIDKQFDLSCTLSSCFPKATSCWLKNGETLTFPSDIFKCEDSNSTLKLSVDKCDESMRGQYTLKASNELGEAETTCNVEILGKFYLIFFIIIKYL